MTPKGKRPAEDSKVFARYSAATEALINAAAEFDDLNRLALVRGALGHRATRILERNLPLSVRMVGELIKNLWATESGSEVKDWKLVRELEAGLSHYPKQLVSYLRETRAIAWEREERTALLYVALNGCDTPPERELILGEIEAEATATPLGHGSRKRPMLPPSQQTVFTELLAQGRLFFSRSRPRLSVRLRLNPLIAGPTGVGKSFLVEQVAARLDAHFIKLAAGDWVPTGGSGATPSIELILKQVNAHRRVVLFIDELDKWRADFNSAWSRSCASDLWQLLDRSPGLVEFASDGSKLLTQEAIDRLKQRLWIVGAGTWQHLHRPHTTLGFRTSGESIQSRVESDPEVPEELRLRFNPQLLVLRYPLPDESEAIFKQTGLLALAQQAGVTLDPRNHDWTKGGMRTLEDLATRLVMKRSANRRNALPR